MTITSDRFLDGVKRRISLPANENLLSDSDLLQLADDVTKERVVPVIRSVRQDYFVTITDTDFVVDQKYYDIPYRAVGRTIRDLKLRDQNDNRRDMALIAIEDEHYFVPSTIPIGFYFYGDRIAIVPTPTDDTYGIEIWWEMPPSLLVPVDEAAVVSSLTDTTVTVDAVPSGITTGSVIDFIKGTSGNSTIAYDKTITGIASTTLSFASDVIPDNLAVGDYISLAETTPVLQLPNEAAPLLEALTCQRALGAVSDFEGADRLQKSIDDAEKYLKINLEPRAVGESTVFVNRKSLLRGVRGRFLTSGYYF